MSIIRYPNEFEERWKEETKSIRSIRMKMDQVQKRLLDGDQEVGVDYSELESQAMDALDRFLEEFYSRLDWFVEFGLIGLLAGISRSPQDANTLEEVYQIIANDLLNFMQQFTEPFIYAKRIPGQLKSLQIAYQIRDQQAKEPKGAG